MPARGGLWIHQTGGVKVPIPDEWLIGVADDRQIGAAAKREKMHVDFTMTASLLEESAPESLAAHRAQARKDLESNRYRVTAETEEPYHGYPSFQLSYEGTVKGRFVRGQDIWVFSPKAIWLISIDGDAPLLRQMAEPIEQLLEGIHFL